MTPLSLTGFYLIEYPPERPDARLTAFGQVTSGRAGRQVKGFSTVSYYILPTLYFILYSTYYILILLNLSSFFSGGVPVTCPKGLSRKDVLISNVFWRRRGVPQKNKKAGLSSRLTPPLSTKNI